MATHRPIEADHHAWESALRPKVCLLANHETLRTIMASKQILWTGRRNRFAGSCLRKVHSSQQREHACVPRNHLSRQLIRSPGVLKRAVQHLRSGSIRRSRHSRAAGQSRGQIVDTVSISERPAEVEDRAIPVIGRRPARRQQKQSYRNPGGTTFAFCHAHQSAGKDTTTVVAAFEASMCVNSPRPCGVR